MRKALRPKRFEKVAIANRGEVAVRIIQACQEIGIETVLLHSEADVASRAYRMADECVCIGASSVQESYLSIEANVAGAKSAGADAIHPGFGFLSENAEFAEQVEDSGLVFIGPSADSIRTFGDKMSAKVMAQQSGLPLIPGYQGADQSDATLVREIERMGYPVIVKAAGGGGGRGLKVVRKPEEALAAVQSARREGLSAFKDERIFLEKYLDRAKHIEVQILGDASGHIHCLGERECSVQRRHQKVIEEAGAAQLDASLREEILKAATRLASEAEYRNAGTIEFLVQDDQFYFMEMNTRLQVEHGVTEMVWGVDLVKAQLLTAQGRSIHWGALRPQGHAIECRIYAEDPYLNGVPSTGTIGSCIWPQGAGRRFDFGFEDGDSITSYYDSMIAKVLVHDETRMRAIDKMQRTLSELIVFGLKTNIPYLKKIVAHPEFLEGVMNTRFIETHFATGLKWDGLSRFEMALAEKLSSRVADSIEAGQTSVKSGPSPWTHSWRPQ